MLQFLRYIYLAAILFGYTVEFPLLGGLTSRRLVLIVAIITLFVKSKESKLVLSFLNKPKIQRSAILLTFCAFLTYIHHLNSAATSAYGHIEYWYYFFNLLYILVFALYCAVEFRSLKELAIVWVGIMIVESFVIYYAVINTPFRIFIYENFYWGDDRFAKTVEWGSRIVGIGIHSATGSLTMSTAALLLMFMKIKGKIRDGLFYICFLLIFIATAFIGRTGMMVELGLFAFYFIFYGHSVKKQLLTIISASIVFIGITYMAKITDTGFGEGLLNWILGVFDSEMRGEALRGISSNGFPPLSFDSIFGTGITTGYHFDGKIYSPDSGYIRMWISIGIIGFLAYYFAMFYMMTSPRLRLLPNDDCRFLWFAVFLAFFVEYKEPFMMKYIFPWFIITMYLVAIKDIRRKNVII